MKRSEINALIRKTDEFIRDCHFYLPPFANWTPEEWKRKGPEVREIVDRQLGWDITDFGSGRFEEIGLVIFTIRNGDQSNLEKGQGKLYAEKLLIVELNQHTPFHFHWRKMEDIINRGGGNLVIQLHNATEADRLADTEVLISTDGVERRVPAGGAITLAPGESITLPQRCYHEFWAEGRKVLAGEVSLVNDDNTDNRFLDPVGRFPTIEEDEAPLYPLCTEYENYFTH